MKQIIIIGTGLAGYTLAKEFRKLNKTDCLMLITQDDGCFYSKPTLSTALTQHKAPDDLAMTSVDDMAVQLDATIHTHWEVSEINPKDKKLNCVNDQNKRQVLSYDFLVLANGAEKVKAKLSGDAVNDVLSVNSLSDYRQFHEKIANKKHVVILGAGLVGCEFANDLLNAGHEVSVIAPTQSPLSSLVPEAVGHALQKVFAEKGVDWRLSCHAESVNQVDGQFAVQLSDGQIVTADLVLSAVGIRPNIFLAKQAGLSVNHGVIVNKQLQTTDQTIFALGDCAEVSGSVKMYVAPILQQAKVLAKVLAGENANLQYPVMPIVVKTTNCPITLVLPESNDGEWVCETDGGSVKALFKREDGKLLGFALSGGFVKDRMALVKQMMSEQ